jgi:hypothetical protein
LPTPSRLIPALSLTPNAARNGLPCIYQNSSSKLPNTFHSPEGIFFSLLTRIRGRILAQKVWKACEIERFSRFRTS